MRNASSWAWRTASEPAGACLARNALGFYILDNDAFTMSFEIAAIFAITVGFVLLTGGFALRAIGGAAILAGAALFITGLVGTISIQSSISQVGLLLLVMGGGGERLPRD